MVKYTTDPITFKIDLDYDISEVSEAIITFKQKNNIVLEKSLSENEFYIDNIPDSSSYNIVCPMQQEDYSKFSSGIFFIQVAFIRNGERTHSKPFRFFLSNALHNSVI